MRWAALLLCLGLAQADTLRPGVNVQQGGVAKGRAQTLNFSGATVSQSGSTATVTVSGGPGGSSSSGVSGTIQTSDGAGGFSSFAGASCSGSTWMRSLTTGGTSSCLQPAWGDLSGVPLTFAPSAHTHPASDLTATGIGPAVFLRGDNAWASPPAQDWSVITGKPATFPATTPVATASALASTPTTCTGQAATGVLANGNATGCYTPAGTYSLPAATATVLGGVKGDGAVTQCAGGKHSMGRDAAGALVCVSDATIPADISGASFVTTASEATLSNERALAAGSGTTVNTGTAGQVKIDVTTPVASASTSAALSANYVASVGTTAPLSGGAAAGNASALTLSVGDATTLAKGVLQLAGQLGGTATSPTVIGVTGAIVGVSNISATGTPGSSNFLRGDGTWNPASGSGAPSTSTYITQTADAGLSGEQALSTLGTGLLKNTTATGVLTIASAGTDYQAPLTLPLSIANGGTANGSLSVTAGNLLVTDGTKVATLADAAVGSALVSGGAGVAPAYSATGTCTSSSATTCTITSRRSGCAPVCSMTTSVSTTFRAAISTTTITCTFGTSGTNTCNCICF